MVGQTEIAVNLVLRPMFLCRDGPVHITRDQMRCGRSPTLRAFQLRCGTSVTGSVTSESAFPIALRREVTQLPLGVLTDLHWNW
jgi:hypothetical protein